MIENPFKKLDRDRAKRSSNVLRQVSDSETVINRRLKITILCICLAFAVIGGRLFQLQIIENDEYETKMTSYTTQNQTIASPRGTIYDRNGTVLVESVSSFTISYYPIDTITTEEEWTMAKNLVSDLNLKPDDITDRQVKDMYIEYMSEMEDDDLDSLLTKKQVKLIEDGKADEDQIYDWKLDAIDVDQFDNKTKAMFQVYMNMNSGTDGQFKTVVKNVTNKQLAFISENSSKYPGFKATFDWERETTSAGESLKAVLGRVSTETQGIPEDDQEYYLGLGYSMNDRVGTSGIEEQYEEYLAGTKSVYNIEFDENGNAYLDLVSSGKNGYDLTLTIDSSFQKKVDKILKNLLKEGESNSYRSHFDNIYLVAMNPKTGEILAMSGMSHDEDGNIYSNPTGTYLSACQVGSAVKIATVYMGLNEGVISEGEVIVDEPMEIEGTQTISSFNNYGAITDVQAIAVSSNVYMWNIAIRLAGGTYVKGQSLGIGDPKDTFKLMRSYYNMFGLGVKTGLDLPDEEIGSIGNDSEVGTLLYYAIGQYDTYTTMQLAQYCATIANNGKRVAPHVLKYVSEVNDRSTIVYTKVGEVLNTLAGDTDLLKDEQQGMQNCITSGHCGALTKSDVGVTLASKTGTAETTIYENGVSSYETNSTQIAYGPVDDPEIVFACSAPTSSSATGSNVQTNVCGEAISAVAKEYFKNYSSTDKDN